MTDAAAAIPQNAIDTPVAKRNALLLAVASAFGGSIAPVGITLGGLTGVYLLGPDKSLATLPVSAFTVGVAAAAIPAAMLMRRIGRRAGFQLGAAVSALSGLVTGWSVLAGSFWLFVAGMAVAGAAGAFGQQYRFAAADSGTPAFRARAISWVLAGGVASAVIGPQAVILTRDLTSPIPFAGSYFAIIVFSLLALAAVSFLGGAAAQPPPPAVRGGGRPLGEIVRQPRFLVAVACATASFAAMSLVMTAAPLAMVACGLGQDNAALGIQWHALAMFAPSFITGSLIARFGKETIIAVGMALLAACVIVAVMGIELLHFWVALVLLGVGWNFGFIGATAMLTETYRPQEQGPVQGLNDFILFGSVALASLLSGPLFSGLGWTWVNVVALPIVAVGAVALALLFRTRAARTI
jgi:predicted MFS family arabinose efflux permease